ncbi:RNA-binding protein [Orenia metallireducens]|uniref:RNA-binding protein n=1 Tax=Orenia metallireducens TaxID=1413210 RepID=A0A1C0ACT5_9FIRM|nr:DUF721 domain-containing protein [Orenia metallireducens]OCL28433.1 RNA-binding protein [Orenia metallireducens]
MADLIENILNKTLNKLGIEEKIKEKRALDLWSEINGSEIIKHTEAKYINQGILFVVVDSPVWAHQLLFMKREFISKINSKMGKPIVKDIRFQSGKVFSSNNNEKEEINYKNIELDDLEVQEIFSISNFISDNELKQKFASLLEADIKIKKWKQINEWIPCPECSVLIDPNENKCVICELREKSKKIDINKIEEILTNTPWLSYEEVLNIYPNILQEEFESIKNQLIIKMKVKLDELITDVLKKEVNSKEVKVFVQKYVMLEASVHPDHLNNRLIQKIIGENYMKIYRSL